MNCNNTCKQGCDFNVKTVGLCDVSRLNINGNDNTNLNWTQISVPEILTIPEVKPDIEAIDQVYANICLETIKLIETPFAYKQYVLYSFYTSANGLTTTLPALITSLGTAVTSLIDPLNTTLITTLETLSTALNAFSGVPGVSQLITAINAAVTSIEDLVTSITTALSDVTTAATNLLAAIATVPFSPSAICSAIQALKDALTALTTLVDSIIGVVTGILTTLENALALIPAIGALLTPVIAAIQTLIETTLPPLIDAVTAIITNITNALLPVDCTNATVFVLIANAEGTCLSGRKLIIEGVLKQKIVYTAEVATQSVHSAHFDIPFISYIIPYAKFEGVNYVENVQVYDPETNGPITINGYQQSGTGDITVDLNEDFNVDKCIEDIFVYALDTRRIFKNVTVFLKATPKISCDL